MPREPRPPPGQAPGKFVPAVSTRTDEAALVLAVSRARAVLELAQRRASALRGRPAARTDGNKLKAACQKERKAHAALAVARDALSAWRLFHARAGAPTW